MGLQLIMADPIRDGTLMVSEFTKERKIVPPVPPNPLTVAYWVTVKNIGAFETIFTIQGGGVV
jgi:hypothetical protein